MKTWWKKGCTLLMGTACILFLSGFSGEWNPRNLLQEGADAFSEGKTEQDYIGGSGNLIGTLNEFIEDYIGFRQYPEPMDADTAQEIADDADDEDIIGGEKETEVNGETTEVVIGSERDLKRAMRQMMDETKTVFYYQTSGGYTVDMIVMEQVLTELEREEPIDGICIASFGFTSDPALVFDYTMPTATIRSMKEDTRDLLAQAERKINIQGLTDYEIVQAVDAFVCDLITYPDQDLAAYPGTLQGYAPESHTAYSAFQNNSAVCDGYARTTMLLLNDFHIKTDFLVGDCYNGGSHAWNMVYLDDAWYHLDVCWNDGSETKDYFLVSDAYMEQSRTWDRSIYPTSALQNYQ